MSAYDTSHEILTAALGLLTATHADHRMAGPVTMDYLAGVPTDRSQMLNLIGMRVEESGLTPEETLKELGRRVQELLRGPE
jgi:hypothetical protein